MDPHEDLPWLVNVIGRPVRLLTHPTVLDWYRNNPLIDPDGQPLPDALYGAELPGEPVRALFRLLCDEAGAACAHYELLVGCDEKQAEFKMPPEPPVKVPSMAIEHRQAIVPAAVNKSSSNSQNDWVDALADEILGGGQPWPYLYMAAYMYITIYICKYIHKY